MRIVTIHAAKTDLSTLIEQALAGEEIVIARGDEPVVRLVPVERPEPRREYGALRGRLVIPESFHEPLPSDELDAWEG